MSRCFPFPPPGYMRNGSRSEALIESIKLRKETEKPKKDRKEKKEKKEKKREKKEKKEKTKEKKERKHKEGTTSHSSDGGKKFKLINEIKEPKADGTLQKGEDCENDQLERSGITEELDQAVSSVEPCCLSDSTQSSKRKRSDSQSSHDHGSTIKIRLPLRKHREPEESSKSELKYEVGSSSATVGIAGPLSRENIGKNQKLQCLTNTGSKQVIGNSDCKVLQNNLVQEDAIPMVTNKPEDESQGVASLYKSLLQFPPLTSDGFDLVDEDWLFSSVQADARPVSKKPKFDSDMFQCSKPLWPRAQYLPAVEVYALPYTVPF